MSESKQLRDFLEGDVVDIPHIGKCIVGFDLVIGGDTFIAVFRIETCSLIARNSLDAATFIGHSLSIKDAKMNIFERR